MEAFRLYYDEKERRFQILISPKNAMKVLNAITSQIEYVYADLKKAEGKPIDGGLGDQGITIPIDIKINIATAERVKAQEEKIEKKKPQPIVNEHLLPSGPAQGGESEPPPGDDPPAPPAGDETTDPDDPTLHRRTHFPDAKGRLPRTEGSVGHVVGPKKRGQTSGRLAKHKQAKAQKQRIPGL